jgi:hypothetical protein
MLLRSRTRHHIDPLIVRDDDVAGPMLNIGKSKWDEIKQSPLGKKTLDIVRLGPNSVGYTTASVRRLVDNLPRDQWSADDEDAPAPKPVPTFPKDRKIRRTRQAAK